MATNSAYIQIATSNAYQFANASNNDLVLFPTIATQQMLVGTSNGAYANMTYTPCNLTMSVVGGTTASGINFNTNNNATKAMTIAGTGNVGIGSTSPAYTLDVNGSIRTGGIVGNYNGNNLINNITGAPTGSNTAIQINGVCAVVSVGVNAAWFTDALSGDMVIRNSGGNIRMGANSGTTSAVTILSSGNIGIGSTSPAYPLDVNGAMRLGGNQLYFTGGNCFIDGLTSSQFIFGFSTPSSVNGSQIVQVYGRGGAGGVLFQINNAGTSSGTSAVQTNVPLVVANLSTGTVYCNGQTLTSTNPSDIKLKNDVVSLSNALEVVEKMRPVAFKWIDHEKHGKQQEYGMIAQELQKVLPELVHRDPVHDVLGYDPLKLLPFALQSIKELHEENKKLKKDVAFMMNEFHEWKASPASSKPNLS